MDLCHDPLLTVEGGLLEPGLDLTNHVCLLVDPLAQIVLSFASELDLLLKLSTQLVVHETDLLPGRI